MPLVENALGFNLKVLQIFGFYSPSKYQTLYRMYTYASYLIFVIPVPFLASFKLLSQKSVTLAQVADSAFIIFAASSSVLKLFPFLAYEKEVRDAIFLLEENIFEAKTQHDVHILDDYIEVNKRNSRLFLILCIACVVNWGVAPFFEAKRTLPLDIWLPFDPYMNTGIFCFMYFYIVTAVGVGAATNGVIDPLIAGLTYFGSIQYKILKYNLQYLTETSNNRNILHYNMKKCIKHHIAIIHYVAHFGKIFSLPIFSQLMATLLGLCISLFRLNAAEPFTVVFFSMSLFSGAILFQIYFYCYYGTTLSEESDTLTTAMYMSEWYTHDMELRKTVIIFMEFSRNPMVMAAGKILDLSLPTFSMIVRKSYSLLAVLKNY